MKYQSEIDYLRALSVIAVVLYHFNFNVLNFQIFSGGFLGVDIFFVISGYLISSIILNDYSNGTFNLFNFYERRARRILPLLFFIIIVTYIFSFYFFDPNSLITLCKSIISAIFFYSNFFFWQIGSYNLDQTQNNPLLHTWSLSIEEQFYIIFPIIVILINSFKFISLKFFVLLIFFLSLIISFLSDYYFRNAGFYLLPTRAWEISLGIILTFYLSSEYKLKYISYKLINFLSLLLIFFVMFFINDREVNRTLYTLITCISVSFIIINRKKIKITNKKIELIVLQLGLISYSIYLWHLPINIFVIENFLINSFLYKLIIILLLIIISYFTYIYIEKPFRDKKFITTKNFYRLIFSITFILLFLSYITVYNNGFLKRFSQNQLLINMFYEQNDLITDKKNKNCHERNVNQSCLLNENNKKNIIFVGDSLMAYLSTEIYNKLKFDDYSFRVLTKGACPYTPGLKQDDYSPCTLKDNLERQDLLLKSKKSIVIINSWMRWYLSGQYKYDDKIIKKENILRIDDELFGSSNDVNATILKTIKDSITELIEYGHKVILVYPTPETNIEKLMTQHLIEKSKKLSKKEFDLFLENYFVPEENFFNYNKVIIDLYDTINHTNLIRVYPHKIMCNDNKCRLFDADNIFMIDQSHLSIYGNNILANIIVKKIKNIKW